MCKKDSLLWEIHINQELKGYLFGTMHIPGKIAFSNFSHVSQYLQKCDIYAPEIPLDDKTQGEISKHIMLPNGNSITHYLSDKKYDKLSKILKKAYQLNLEQFERILPIYLLNYITQLSLDIPKEHLNHSMDMELWEKAQESGLIMSSVESVEDHINTLYDIPIEYQLQSLKGSLKNVSKFRQQTQKMLALYRQEAIHKLYSKSKKSLGEIKNVLLYRRNKNMVKSILELTNKGIVFVAIGAGHLSGSKGLLHLLKQHQVTLIAKPISSKS